MPGEKRFGTSLFGYSKSDVNSYIEKMLKEFENKLKEKDDEIASLSSQYREIRQKYDELSKKADLIEEERDKIAGVLITARENAQKMMEDARNQAMAEKKRLEEAVEQEREKLVDAKTDLKRLKAEAVSIISKFVGQLDNLIGEEYDETEERLVSGMNE